MIHFSRDRSPKLDSSRCLEVTDTMTLRFGSHVSPPSQKGHGLNHLEVLYSCVNVKMIRWLKSFGQQLNTTYFFGDFREKSRDISINNLQNCFCVLCSDFCNSKTSKK